MERLKKNLNTVEVYQHPFAVKFLVKDKPDAALWRSAQSRFSPTIHVIVAEYVFKDRHRDRALVWLEDDADYAARLLQSNNDTFLG